MKGLMVTLLIFLTTGIVVGQQGSSSRTVSNPDTSGQSLLKPLEISVPETAIRDLRSGKVLFSEIAPVSESGEQLNPNVVNGVTLYPEGKNLNLLSRKTVRGQGNGEGVLQFGLTNADLIALQNNQLSMEFGAAERGKYRAIKVFYLDSAGSTQNSTAAQQPAVGLPARPTVRPTTRPTTRPTESSPFAFGRPNETANNSTQQPASNPYIPLPAPHEPGDLDFMGPTRPAAGAWGPPDRTTQNNPALLRPRENGFVNNRSDQNDNQLQNGGWRFPDQNKNGFEEVRQNPRQEFVQDNRQEILEANKAKWEAERLQREYEEEMARRQQAQQLQREKEEQEFAQWKWEREQQELLRSKPRTQYTSTHNFPTTIGSRLTPEQQFDYNRAIFELEQRENLLISQQDSLNRKQTLLNNREYQLNLAQGAQQNRNNGYGQTQGGFNQGVNHTAAKSNGEISHPMHWYPPENIEARNQESSRDIARKAGYSDNGFRAPNRNDDSSSRVARNTKSGISSYKASVAGPGTTSSTTNRDDRVDGFVLFLLLCSLGLNFYLAFIARGFYVRYHELADELRETFSTTH